MGNIFSTRNDLQNPSHIDILEIEKLKKENLLLKEKLNKMQCSSNTSKLDEKTLNNIDKFIENWYEKNINEVDIGVVNIPIVGDIDILPDYIEKYIYKKSLTIAMSFLKETINESEINILNNKINLVMK